MLEVSKFSHRSNQALWLLGSKGMELPDSMKFMLVSVYTSMPLCKTDTVVTSCETEYSITYNRICIGICL